LESRDNASVVARFLRLQRRREPSAVLAPLVHDPSLISREMIEELLRYKRLDGVDAALRMTAQAWFPGGRQAFDLRPALAALTMPVQAIWGRDDRIVPVAH